MKLVGWSRALERAAAERLAADDAGRGDSDSRLAKRWQTMTPPPRLSVSEWADRERMLSPEASAEPGKWITARNASPCGA